MKLSILALAPLLVLACAPAKGEKPVALESQKGAPPGAPPKKESPAGAQAKDSASSKAPSSPLVGPQGADEAAVVETNLGQFVFKFRPDMAPRHVANFKELARKKFYDGLTFHRVIPGFMVQGGCPNTRKGATGVPGTGDAGKKLDAEFNTMPHVRGVVSMARSLDPNSASCQFFVVHKDSRHLDRQYSAFGEVVKGIEVIDKIAEQPTGPQDAPISRIEIKSVEIKPWPLPQRKRRGTS